MMDEPNVLDEHLPPLLARAQELETILEREECERAVAEGKLHTLETCWHQARTYALQDGVWFDGYHDLIEAIQVSFARSRERIVAMATKRTGWEGLLNWFLGVANKVLRFFRLPEIPRPVLSAVKPILQLTGIE